MDAHIKKSRDEFEKRFKEGSYYNKQTQDEEHIKLILDKLNIKPGDKILDFGTGLGYLSFAITQRYPECEVIGLDIVEDALEINRQEAKKRGLENLSFISYNGNKLPFKKESFDIAVTRYVMHHVPNIEDIICQLNGVLRYKGKLFISDPTPFDIDTDRFVDSFMQMIKDGHVKFYTINEYKKTCRKCRL